MQGVQLKYHMPGSVGSSYCIVNSPRIGAEEMPQAQRRVAGDRALAIQISVMRLACTFIWY